MDPVFLDTGRYAQIFGQITFSAKFVLSWLPENNLVTKRGNFLRFILGREISITIFDGSSQAYRIILDKYNPGNYFRIIVVLAIILLGLLEGPTQAEENLPKLNKSIQPAVVTVIGYDADGKIILLGSGFFINGNGHIITNGHVVAGVARAEVKTADGARYPLKAMVSEDREADLVKLVVEGLKSAPHYLPTTQPLPGVGERVVVVGSPMGLEQTVSDGMVTGIRNIHGRGGVLQISAPISPGSSGGPVVNLRGEVIGVASFQIGKGQKLNFAIPGKRVQGMIDFTPRPLAEKDRKVEEKQRSQQGQGQEMSLPPRPKVLVPSPKLQFPQTKEESPASELLPVSPLLPPTTPRQRKKTNPWKTSTLSFTGPWTPKKVKCVVPKSDSTVFAVSEGYNAAVDFNYITRATSYLGATSFSPYTAIRHASGEIYVGGYSNRVMRYDSSRPWTLTSSNGNPRSPSDKNKPNPFFIRMAGENIYHYRFGLDYDHKGIVWIGGNTTRGNPDHGNVMWYNPADGTAGYVFPGWQAAGTKFSNLCASNSRTLICVSDNVGKIWIIDTATRKVAPAPIVPVPGQNTKTYMIEAEPGIVLGIVFAPGPAYKIIRFKPATKEVITLKNLGVLGTPFGFGDNQYSRMNYKLEMGPDGFIWMFVGNSLYRVDPTTCVFSKIMDTNYAKLKFASNNDDLLLYSIDGTTDFKYIPGILQAVSP